VRGSIAFNDSTPWGSVRDAGVDRRAASSTTYGDDASAHDYSGAGDRTGLRSSWSHGPSGASVAGDASGFGGGVDDLGDADGVGGAGVAMGDPEAAPTSGLVARMFRPPSSSQFRASSDRSLNDADNRRSDARAPRPERDRADSGRSSGSGKKERSRHSGHESKSKGRGKDWERGRGDRDGKGGGKRRGHSTASSDAVSDADDREHRRRGHDASLRSSRDRGYDRERHASAVVGSDSDAAGDADGRASQRSGGGGGATSDGSAHIRAEAERAVESRMSVLEAQIARFESEAAKAAQSRAEYERLAEDARKQVRLHR
jgi:hypothetical protein